MARNPLSQVLATPLGDMVAEIGMGIAEAQYAIDAKTIENMKEIYSLDDEVLQELRNIGYRPSWYVIPEAEAEINIALTLGQTRTNSGTTKTQLFGATVDATYQNQFDFSLKAASRLKLKFAPVPAPAQLDEMDVVPQVGGMRLGAAIAIFDKLGITAKLPSPANNNKLVTATKPPAGTLIEHGDSVEIIT